MPSRWTRSRPAPSPTPAPPLTNDLTTDAQSLDLGIASAPGHFTALSLDASPAADASGTESVALDLTRATRDLDEPVARGCEPGNQSIAIAHTAWFRVTPRADTNLHLSTLGSDMDTALAVYRGPDPRHLEPL